MAVSQVNPAERDYDGVSITAIALPFAADSSVTIQPAKRIKQKSNRRKRARHLSAPFRLRMLGIFATQLALVWGLLAIWTYLPSASDPLKVFFHGHRSRIWILFLATVVLLLVLYFMRMGALWKWLFLLMLSSAQSVLFASLGLAHDTNIIFFNCGATFCLVLVLILLTGTHDEQDDDTLDMHNPVIGAVLAYLIIAIVSFALFFTCGRSLMTSKGFGISLGFQFMLTLWLAFDTRYIYRVMATGEAMQGAINLYTDMIAFVLMLLWLISSIVSMCDGSSNFCCDGGCMHCSHMGDSGFYGYYDFYGCYDAQYSCDWCNCCSRCNRMKVYPSPVRQDMQHNGEIQRV